MDDDLRGRIIGRLKCGRMQVEVSHELGTTQRVIFRLKQRFQEYVNISKCFRTALPRVTTTGRRQIFVINCQKKQAEYRTRSISTAVGIHEYHSFETSDVFETFGRV